MPDFTSVTLSPPKDWQEFERSARFLFEFVLSDPGVQNNGTSGQRQHGVDLYGRRGGGTGPLVGVQCKGKTSGYRRAVTEDELKDEVEKARDFVPRLDEFKLITTAPDDAKIQEAARLLEQKMRAEGWSVSIEVWGWGRLEEEIARHPEAIRRFHPDATPFTGELLDRVEETRQLAARGSEATQAVAADIAQMRQMLEQRLPRIASDPPSALHDEINKQIDSYRDLLRHDQPRTAIKLLTNLLERLGENAGILVRYRVLSNIGAAHYNLGEFDAASNFLLRAASLNPDDPISLANRTAALLIKGQKAEAHAIAVDAIARYPESKDVGLQRLQARSPGESVDSVWSSLSERARAGPMALGMRIVATREEGDPAWPSLAREAILVFPTDEPLQIVHAESVIESLLRADPGGVGLQTGNVPTQDDLKKAAETLEKAWKDSLGKETPAKAASAHNAALAFNLIGESERAAQLLDAAIAAGFDANESRQNRIVLFHRAGKINEAIRLADGLNDTPVSRIIRADLRIDSAPAEAREILAARAAFTDSADIIAASLVVVESLIKENKFAEALIEAGRLELALPTHPQGPLSVFRVKRAQGEDTEDALDCAMALVIDDTDFPTRFLVADALASANRFDDVVTLLEGRTATNFDSPALRALLAAAVNADMRVLARKILNALPAALFEMSFYQKARIALTVRTGNIASAETEIRSFLAGNPSNLELHLQLMHTLFRQDKRDALRAEVARPAAGFSGSPQDFMKFAHFKGDFGDWREAYALGYKTVLAHPANASVSMGFVGLMFRQDRSSELVAGPSHVDVNTAVGLILDDGTTSVYIIEPVADLRPTAQYLAPEHPVTKLLLGKSAGDEVELPDKTHARIEWIKSKEVHALHDILANFNNRYPEAEGLERVRIDISGPEGLEPIFERVRDRHDAIEQVSKLYESGSMPLALVATAMGCEPFEALVGLATSGKTIRSCDGTHAEREAALRAIRANDAKGCVVDSATLHIIRRLKLEKAIAAICGPIGIVERTALLLQQRIHELGERLDQPDMSISYRDGQYYRQETTPEEKRGALALAEEDRLWLAENAAIIPAEGAQDPSPAWRPLIERFGSDFLDEVLAAQGSGRILICEDQLLRLMAQIDFHVPGTWLQPILMRALADKAMTKDEYREAIVHLIDARFAFISVSPDVLVSAVTGVTGHVLPPAFGVLTSRLGGQKADLQSHLAVAINTAFRIWSDRSLSLTVQQAALGRLLERMIEGRSIAEIRVIIATWIENGPRKAATDSVTGYIFGWLRGHFIQL